MPLTTRTNGSSGSNQITAAWFNDFKDLLTGVMKDQEVTIASNLSVNAIGTAPTSAPTGVLATGSTLGVGTYKYWYTWVNGDGETTASPLLSKTTTTGNTNVNLSAIAVGPTGTLSRNIYRSLVGGSTSHLLHTIADNTTTTYNDSTADSSINSNASYPLWNTLGGTVVAKDSNGVIQASLLGDAQGSAVFSGTWIGQSNSAGGGIGVKDVNNKKLMEIHNNGNLTILGSQYQTNAGSVSTVSGQPFSNFDIAEIFECDRAYPQGTVVCPGENNKMVRCVHDNCHAASVISHNPGLKLGTENDEKGYQSVALAGRVNVSTSVQDIDYRSFVVSDGHGGVRPVYPDEPSYTLGFTLNSPVDGQVGILLRPLYVGGKEDVYVNKSH